MHVPYVRVRNVLIYFEDRDPPPTSLWMKIAFILFLILSIVGLVASYA